MKSRLSRILLSILILSLALHTFSLPAQAQSEPIENQTENETMPSELAVRFQRHSETVERPAAIPPSPEVIAKTKAQVESFNCASVEDVSILECEALVALYGSTNGAGWYRKDNWLEDTKVSSWFGVTVDTGVIEINLSNNQLSGSIPAGLDNLSNLQILWLGYNQLTGSIPAELGNLSNLEFLALENNQLTGGIPAELGNLSKLEVLYLFENFLTGSIPTTLGKLFNLEILYLSDNQLTGGIPAILGNLSNLWALLLDSNQLTGSIPAELGKSDNLLGLLLSGNQLTGSIPAELGNLNNLEGLLLSGNQLTGSIPAELSNLSKLQELYLSQNQLTGSIPEELGQLTNLKYLRLNDNLFEGDIPNNLVNLIYLCESFDQNNGCEYAENGLDLGYNRLNAPVEEPLASFLEIKDPDWYKTQAVKATILGESGGIIQSRDGMIKIEIPAGAYVGERTFHFIPHSVPGHSLGDLTGANNYFELITIVKGEEVNSFALPLKVTINYTDQQIDPILEERLNLYHWKSDQSVWKNTILACPAGRYTRNAEENWLSLPLCELGEFALVDGPEIQNIFLPLVTR